MRRHKKKKQLKRVKPYKLKVSYKTTFGHNN